MQLSCVAYAGDFIVKQLEVRYVTDFKSQSFQKQTVGELHYQKKLLKLMYGKIAKLASLTVCPGNNFLGKNRL